MNFSLRFPLGFGVSVLAYTLLFFWPALLSLQIFADYGPFPNVSSQSPVNHLHYDCMIATFPAESVWSVLALLCFFFSTVFSLYLSADIRPASLGDWQPLLLHLFFLVGFGFLNWITLALLSMKGWQYGP